MLRILVAESFGSLDLSPIRGNMRIMLSTGENKLTMSSRLMMFLRN